MSEGRVMHRKQDEGVAIAAINGAAAPLTGSQMTSAPGTEIHAHPGQAGKARLYTSVRGRSIVLNMLPWGAGVMFLALWQLRMFHWIFSLESYQLPVPSAIAISIQENANMLFRYAMYSGTEMLGDSCSVPCWALWRQQVHHSFPQVAGQRLRFCRH